MAVEVTVLDRNQGLHQQRRHIIQPDQHPIFSVLGEDAADEHGVQPHDRHGSTRSSLDRADAAVTEADVHQSFGLRPIPELESSGGDTDAVADHGVGPGALRVGTASVAQTPQLVYDILRRQTFARVEFQRSRVDLGRKRPTHAVEARTQLHVQSHGVERQCGRCQAQHNQPGDKQSLAHQIAKCCLENQRKHSRPPRPHDAISRGHGDVIETPISV